MHADNIRHFPASPPAKRCRGDRRCTLRAHGGDIAVVLRNVSAAGAFVETGDAVPVGSRVLLVHPEAGPIEARVTRVADDGAALAFNVGVRASTFALAAICADMTVRAGRDDS
jgi:hypothetical protein